MIKSQLSFAHAVRRDHVNRAQNQAARTLKERKEIEGPQAPRVCKGLWVKLASALLLVLVFLEWSKLWKKRNNSRLSCFQIQHGKDSYWRINSGCLADRRSWSLLAFSRLPLWRRHRLPSVCLCAVHVQFTCSSCAVHVQFMCSSRAVHVQFTRSSRAFTCFYSLRSTSSLLLASPATVNWL